MACEVIHMLSEYYKELCVFDQDLPLKIVEVCLPFVLLKTQEIFAKILAIFGKG